MFSANEKMTVQTPTVGADGEKSPSKCNNSIAPEETEIRNQAQKRTAETFRQSAHQTIEQKFSAHGKSRCI